MRKTLVALAVSVALVMTPGMADAKGKSTQKIHTSKLANCEEMDVQPCFTYDEGKWRVVLSYSPYKAKAVKICKSVFGGDKCLAKKDNKNGTRNYYWGKSF